METRIKEVIFNEEKPNYDHRYFTVIMEDSEEMVYHHHINNPIPSKDKMIGLTWAGLHELCLNMWYESLEKMMRS